MDIDNSYGTMGLIMECGCEVIEEMIKKDEDEEFLKIVLAFFIKEGEEENFASYGLVQVFETIEVFCNKKILQEEVKKD